MYQINGRLAITNGQPFVGNINFCQYADGTNYQLHDGILVIETGVVIHDTTPEGVLKAIEEGALDFWPLTTFHGWDNIGLLKEKVVKMIKEDQQRKERQKLVADLESRFASIPKDLMQSVYNLDHYHQYTDDGKVWRAAQDRHDNVIKQLQEIGAVDFYKEYRKILYKNN